MNIQHILTQSALNTRFIQLHCNATELTSFIFRAHLNKLFEEQNKPQGYVKPVCYAPSLSKRIIYMKAHPCLPFYIFSRAALTVAFFRYDLTCRSKKKDRCSGVRSRSTETSFAFLPLNHLHVTQTLHLHHL